MVGDLYDEQDVRRDAGFSIFYMGINIGAFAAPIICGFLAQSDFFRNLIARAGIDPNSSWHFGFAAAGVGMAFGLIQYIAGRERLRNVGEPPSQVRRDMSPLESAQSNLSTAYVVQMIVVVVLAVAAVVGATYARDFSFALTYVLMPTVLVAGLIAVLLTGMQDKLTLTDWKRLATIFVLFLFSMVFWMGFEQASTSFNAFAEKLTNRTIFGWEFPASWLQAVNPLMIIGFAPVFAWLWVKMGRRQPSDPVKFSVGLLFAGLGFVVVAFAASFTNAGKVTWVWFLLIYFLHTVGELCLSPVGLSSMTKLAPGRMVSLMLDEEQVCDAVARLGVEHELALLARLLQGVDELHGVRHMDVVVNRAVYEQELAVEVCRRRQRPARLVAFGVVLRRQHVALRVD